MGNRGIQQILLVLGTKP